MRFCWPKFQSVFSRPCNSTLVYLMIHFFLVRIIAFLASSIYPSQEHDSNNSPAPVMSVTSNNTGSLPDLSVLQFPSPLATPLDQEDPYNTAGAGTPVSLSPTSPHHMPIGHQSQQSPGQRRRHGSNMPLPSPLVLNQVREITLNCTCVVCSSYMLFL